MARIYIGDGRNKRTGNELARALVARGASQIVREKLDNYKSFDNSDFGMGDDMLYVHQLDIEQLGLATIVTRERGDCMFPSGPQSYVYVVQSTWRWNLTCEIHGPGEASEVVEEIVLAELKRIEEEKGVVNNHPYPDDISIF